ncbi:MAG: hypothetical protein ACJAVS_000478 [Paracoccaceae bacterium]|jgi:hypothetical protein
MDPAFCISARHARRRGPQTCPADPGFVIPTGTRAGGGHANPDSGRRGRITAILRIAPFFDHVKANEGKY